MPSPYTLAWFDAVIAPRLQGYVLTYRSYPEGDFGSLQQVLFESAQKGGSFDFWGLEWLGIHLVDYATEQELFNRLLSVAEESEKPRAVEAFLALL